MKMYEQYDSQEDEDYKPQVIEEKQFQSDMLQQDKKRQKTRKPKCNIQEQWRLLKEQTRIKPTPKQPTRTYQQLVQLSAKILTNSEIRKEKKVLFAGKQFILDEVTGEMREVEKEVAMEVEELKRLEDPDVVERNTLSKQYAYLNHVIFSLQQRYRNINSVHKSKMDWKNFVKKEGIEEKLNYNRKGGALEDVRFIKRTEQKK